MNGAMLRSLVERVQRLERQSVRYRQGVVTSVTPLAVALGGSTVPVSVRTIATGVALRVGDRVAVQTFGNDALVLGRLA